jgi:FtsP/CotA-like multicopper oxidase with cupredoxin domain
MQLDRRQLIIGGLGSLLIPQSGAAASPDLTLRPAPISVRWPSANRDLTGLLGFNGSIPGPEIRVRQGERLNVHLENGLQDGALVHWHGVRVPNKMDGVSILTQEVVPPGATYNYSFVPPDAGTFWYHSHYLSYEQVGRGLFGPLIVEEPNPPEVDHDITAMLADFRTTAEGGIDLDFSKMDDFSREGRLGNLMRVFLSRDTVRLGDRVRLRLVNAAIDRVFRIKLGGLAGAIVAVDGMPLDMAAPLRSLHLAPAQRVDVIGLVTSEISFDRIVGDNRTKLAHIAVAGRNPNPDQGPIAALPPSNLPAPSNPSQTIDLAMRGGAGDSEHGGYGSWAFNGVSGMPAEPLGQFWQGETAHIRLSNQTAFGHGIHLHGHHFREVLEGDRYGPLRDTLLVEAGEERMVVCVFDNPGRWLLHCHMLSHSADGMATWVEVI